MAAARACQVPTDAGEEEAGSAQGSTFQLTDELKDALDDFSAADDVLVRWKALEQWSVAVPEGRAESLPPRCREVAMRLLAELVESMDLAPPRWFTAMALLDTFARRSRDQLKAESLLTVCLAVARVLKKVDNAASEHDIQHLGLEAALVQAGQRLQAGGISAPAGGWVPAQAEVGRAERALLEALQWRIQLPSHESWITMGCLRLDVLTSRAFAPTIRWAWQQCTLLAGAVGVAQAATKAAPSSRLAAGLLGINLVRAALLPLEALRPPQYQPWAWQELYLRTQLGDIPMNPALAADRSQYLLEILLVALRCALPELREACGQALESVARARGSGAE